MQKAAGIALMIIGGFMALGFTQASLSQGPLVIFLSLCLTVFLPLGGGFYLLRSAGQNQKALQTSKSQLAHKTLRAEILRLAAENQGRLTVLEVTQAFALSAEQAEAALDRLALEHLAEHQLTDEGLLVYTFPEVQQLSHKHQAKGLEEF